MELGRADHPPAGRKAGQVVVIGGGVHGLSCAWRLAERGADVLVLEKDRIGSGASGIAGGIVRNYYRSPAVTDLIRQSVEMFEADPEGYGFRQVGYVAAVPQGQVDDLVAIREQHESAGYESELLVGAKSCRDYLTWTWPDWRAPVEAVLHEPRGGWADAMQTVRYLAERARGAGARIVEGVEVTGLQVRRRVRRRKRRAHGRGGAHLGRPGRVRERGRRPGAVGRAPLGDAGPAARGSRWPAPASRAASSSTGRPRRASSRCPGSASAAARGSSRPSSTSTRTAACAPTATAGSCCPAPGASTSTWAVRAPGSPAAGCPCC